MGQPTVRADIIRSLSPAGTKSATVKYLATTLELPARVVREQLEQMGREGVVATRTHKSGEVLFRLRDSQDARWDSLRGPSLHRVVYPQEI